jgi:hypothetical protein
MYKFLGVVFSLILVSLIRGFVLTQLWSWFISPTFPGVPSLTIASALGISLLLGYLNPSYSPDSNEPFAKQLGTAFMKSIMVGIFVLIIGWIYSLFM